MCRGRFAKGIASEGFAQTVYFNEAVTSLPKAPGVDQAIAEGLTTPRLLSRALGGGGGGTSSSDAFPAGHPWVPVPYCCSGLIRFEPFPDLISGHSE